MVASIFKRLRVSDLFVCSREEGVGLVFEARPNFILEHTRIRIYE